METGKLDRRFFESTRGKIVALLRRGNLTVNDLVVALGLTDNAVRAHLLSLGRDGLVTQAGTVKGVRKPHYVYGLTENARDLFPRPYGILFNRLLASLKTALSKAALVSMLREVGKTIGTGAGIDKKAKFETKLETALAAIESLGGSARIGSKNGKVIISSESCPFAEAVAEHPEVCKVTESMLGEVFGTKVSEDCDRSTSPKCRFQLETL